MESSLPEESEYANILLIQKSSILTRRVNRHLKQASTPDKGTKFQPGRTQFSHQCQITNDCECIPLTHLLNCRGILSYCLLIASIYLNSTLIAVKYLSVLIHRFCHFREEIWNSVLTLRKCGKWKIAFLCPATLRWPPLTRRYSGHSIRICLLIQF